MEKPLFIRNLYHNSSNHWISEFQCCCGKLFKAEKSKITGGRTKSCGCYRREVAAQLNKTHGFRAANQRLYDIWRHMISRCTNPKDIGFKNYGGRRIKVCPEWLDITVFFEWALNSGYSDTLTIERNDVHGGYNPANCSWATHEEQRQNTTKTLGRSAVLEIRQRLNNGDKQVDIAREYGVLQPCISKINLRKCYANV